MNKAGIESALQNVAANVPELPFEELAALPYYKMEEHDYITRQAKEDKTVRIRALSLAAACSLAVLFLISGWYLRNKVSDSVITIDVNPSIQIITNRKDKILSVTALNEDARSVIAGNDYSGEKLEDTVDVLMNSLVEQQYIREDQKAILLTVTNKNADKADKIRSRADAAILNSLEAQNIKPTILSQIISKEKSRTKLAGKYNISEGKLKLIQDMISVNSGLSLDLLAQLPIEKLLQLADENSVDLSSYQMLGTQAAPSAIPTQKPAAENADEVKDNREENGTKETDDMEDNNPEDDNTDQNSRESGNDDREIRDEEDQGNGNDKEGYNLEEKEEQDSDKEARNNKDQEESDADSKSTGSIRNKEDYSGDFNPQKEDAYEGEDSINTSGSNIRGSADEEEYEQEPSEETQYDQKDYENETKASEENGQSYEDSEHQNDD